MSNWWVAEAWVQSPVLLVSWVVWVVGSIVLHELGHGWAAIRAGDRTPIESGHMTWNPLVHMGGPSLIVFALVGIAWGAMPVNPNRFRGRHAEASVAIAGPVMNFSLAIVAHVLLVVWIGLASGRWVASFEAPDHVFENVGVFLTVGGVINIVLMLFNLLPVPPLDGSRIVGSFVPSYARLWESPNAGVIALAMLVAAMFYLSGPIFDGAFAASKAVTQGLVERLVRAAP